MEISISTYPFFEMHMGLEFQLNSGIKSFLDKVRMWTTHVHLKTATVRDLSNSFAKLKDWLMEGEDIQIFRRDKPVTILSRQLPHLSGARVFS